MEISTGGRKVNTKKRLFSLVFVISLVLTGCQNDGDSSKQDKEPNEGTDQVEPLHEKPTFTLKQGDDKINSETKYECWIENCSESSVFPSNITGGVDIKKETRGIEPEGVLPGKVIDIEVDGEKPDELSYIELVGSSSKSGTFEDQRFEVYGEGTHYFLMTASWNENGEFQGSKTVGFVLKVQE